MGFDDIVQNKPASHCDIYLKTSKTRIEVRASLPKNEGIYPKKPYLIQFYGWTALKREENEPRYDILICVAIDKETFKNPKFYLFDVDDIKQLGEVELKRFKNVKKKIHLFIDEKSYKNAKLTKPKLVTKYERYINENPNKFLNKWDKIKN